jgi:hypothetical protein
MDCHYRQRREPVQAFPAPTSQVDCEIRPAVIK